MFIANVDYLMSFMIENLGDQMTKVTDRFQKPTKLVMADVAVGRRKLSNLDVSLSIQSEGFDPGSE